METEGSGNIFHEAGHAEAGIGRIAIPGQQHGADADHRPHDNEQENHLGPESFHQPQLPASFRFMK